MLNINKKAFTLVELIVVITILAILGTIGFISLQGYSSEARDSKRVTDLGQIRTGIQVYQAKEGVVPEPNDAITVGSGSTIYTIQGYAGTGTLRSIKVNTDAKDPLSNDYYTYTTNGTQTKFQLLTLLENDNTAYSNVIPTTYANYENRDSYTIGDQLGTLLEPTTNKPVQELGNNIDLSVNTTEYKTVFNKNDIQTLSGIPLYNEIVSRSNDNGAIIVNQEENNLFTINSITFYNDDNYFQDGYNWYKTNVSDWNNIRISDFMAACESINKKLINNYGTGEGRRYHSGLGNVSSIYCTGTWGCTFKSSSVNGRLAFASNTSSDGGPGYKFGVAYGDIGSTSTTYLTQTLCSGSGNRSCYSSEIDKIIPNTINVNRNDVYIPCG